MRWRCCCCTSPSCSSWIGRGRLAAGTGGGLLLALPWLIRVFSNSRQYLQVAVDPGAGGYDPAYLLYLLGPTRGYVLLGLGILGAGAVLAGAFRRGGVNAPGLVAAAAWLGCLLVLLGPLYLGPFRPDHAAIVLFLPVVLLAPQALWLLPREWAVAAALVILVGWGVWETRTIVGPAHVLAVAADRVALSWIDGHVPSDAGFLIDTTTWGATYRAVDGGGWIMPLTGRKTVPPPITYGWGPRAYAEGVRDYAARLYRLAELPDHLYCKELALLADQTGARYYYTRTRVAGRNDRASGCSAFTRVFEDREAGIGVYLIGR